MKPGESDKRLLSRGTSSRLHVALTLLVCGGWAPLGSPRAIQPPDAHPGVSAVAPAIDFSVGDRSSARMIRARLIAREEPCDTYCWARVQVVHAVTAKKDDDLHGEIRVAYRAKGAGIPRGEVNLFVLPYNQYRTKLWRLSEDRTGERPQATPLEAAKGWAEALAAGDPEWMGETTALPFSFRPMVGEKGRGSSPDGAGANAKCQRTLTTAADIAPWLRCIHASNIDETTALAFSFGRPSAQLGLQTATPRLQREARLASKDGQWAHVVAEYEGIRIDMALLLRERHGAWLVSTCLMERTLSPHAIKEENRRRHQRLFTSAISRNDLAAVRSLLKRGAAVDEVGSDEFPSDPPLTLAAELGRIEIVDLLLAAGADPNACCCSCVTSLHSAIHARHGSVVRRLLKAGADPEIPYDGKMSSLELAHQTGNTEIVRMIDEHLAAKSRRD